MTDWRWLLLFLFLAGFALLQGLAQIALGTLWEGKRPSSKEWYGLGIVIALSGICLVFACMVAMSVARDALR